MHDGIVKPITYGKIRRIDLSGGAQKKGSKEVLNLGISYAHIKRNFLRVHLTISIEKEEEEEGCAGIKEGIKFGPSANGHTKGSHTLTHRRR